MEGDRMPKLTLVFGGDCTYDLINANNSKEVMAIIECALNKKEKTVSFDVDDGRLVFNVNQIKFMKYTD